MRPLFLFFISLKTIWLLFVAHFKYKNVDILILTMNIKINEATFFNSSLKKKTDEGHLKQMREGLRNIFYMA